MQSPHCYAYWLVSKRPTPAVDVVIYSNPSTRHELLSFYFILKSDDVVFTFSSSQVIMVGLAICPSITPCFRLLNQIVLQGSTQDQLDDTCGTDTVIGLWQKYIFLEFFFFFISSFFAIAPSRPNLKRHFNSLTYIVKLYMYRIPTVSCGVQLKHGLRLPCLRFYPRIGRLCGLFGPWVGRVCYSIIQCINVLSHRSGNPGPTIHQ